MYSNPSLDRYRAHDMVTQWLVGEQDLRSGRERTEDTLGLQDGLGRIMDHDMPAMWDRQLSLRDHPSERSRLLLAGQLILKACDAARTAVVYSDMLNGHDRPQAELRSWQLVHQNIPHGGQIDLHRAVLAAPFAVAIDSASYRSELHELEVRSGLCTMVGLAMAHLYEIKLETGHELMPAPGRRTGFIEGWSPPLLRRGA